MKKTLLMTFAILMIASVALAQPGSIGLFADIAGANCNLLDAAPGLCNIFVVHTNTAASDASQFGIDTPACLLPTFLSYSPNWAVDIAFDAGNPLAGRSVGYGGCRSSPIFVATLAYFCGGTTAACCVQGVVAHAFFGNIAMTDCNSNIIPGAGGEAIWNDDGSCSCDVATHQSTWGGVKEMFRTD